MKRDMDLIRTILLQVEEEAGTDGEGVDLQGPDGKPDDVVYYHVRLLMEAELIDGLTMYGEQKILPTRLTWKGHEFLDSIRNDSVWADVKKQLAGFGGSAAITVIQQLATKVGKEYLGLP